MQGQGTDLDLARDYFKRVDRIDKDVHELKSGFTDINASVARLEAGAQANNELLRDLAQKLDQARTQKTPLFVVVGAVVASMSAALAWQTAFLKPIEQLSRDNYMDLRSIESNRYSDDDAEHDFDRVQGRIDSLDERVRDLERGR